MSPHQIVQDTIQNLINQKLIKLYNPTTKEELLPTDEGFIKLVDHLTTHTYNNAVSHINTHLPINTEIPLTNPR